MHEHHHDHGEHCSCHDHEHHHEHGEHCSCHDHEHHHEHGEHCTCHDHGHHHDHDEHCTCHDHEHHHDHDETCTCHDHEHHHEHHHADPVPGVVTTNVRYHDEAIVVSGELVLTGEYGVIRGKLHESLTAFAAAIAERGGIIGHIKASVTAEQVEMFSVTDEEVMIKTAPQQNVHIILAAIVFCVDDKEAEQLGRKALESVL